MIRTLFLLTVFLVSLPAFAQSTSALDKGEIFVKALDVPGFDYPKMIVTAVVDAPPAKVYEIVGNCDRFPDRMPHIKEARTLVKSPTSYTCEVTVDMPFPMSDLKAITVDQREAGPAKWSRRWRLRDGENDSYKYNSGGFDLTPFNGDPNRTLVRYEVHAVPKSAVPDFVRKSAQKKSMPGLIKRIREEVAKL